MVGRAKSKALKGRIKNEAAVAAVQEAADIYNMEKTKPRKERQSLKVLAAKFKVGTKALWNRVKGGNTILD